MNEIINIGNGAFVKVIMLKGERGTNIASIEKTSTDGLIDTYTVTLTNGDTTTFQVTNGANIGVENLGYVQTSNVAQKAFAVGEHLVLNDQYCVVTQAIAQDTIIVIGTNVDEAIIGDEISDLESRKADKTEVNTLATEKADKTEVNQLATDKADKTDLISEISTRENTDENLQAQIDQLISPSGTAPNPAEIENARIGANNITYPTLGESIRTQISDLTNVLNDVTGIIDAFELNSAFPTFNLKRVIPAGTVIRIAFSNIDITGTYHQFSFKNANGSNLNSYIFKSSNGTENIILEEDAYKIGFALASNQINGIFACFTYNCAYGDMYERINQIEKPYNETIIPVSDIEFPNNLLKKIIPAGTIIKFTFSDIDITGTYHQFSFKDKNGANLNSYLFKSANGYGFVMLDDDAYSIGFALTNRTNDEVFEIEYTLGLVNEIDKKLIGTPYNEVFSPYDIDYPIFTLKKVIPAGTVIRFAFDNIDTTGTYHQFSFKDENGANLNSYIFKSANGYGSVMLDDDAYSIGFALTNRTNDEVLGIEYTSGLVNQIEKNDYKINEIENNIRPIIWDCDNGWDIDDCVAGRILAWGVRQGLVDLMGVVLSSNNGINSVSAMDGLLCAEGIGKCKIGKYPNTEHSYNNGYHQILANYPKHYQRESDATSDIVLYRRALSQLPNDVQADVIITGYTNSFSRFLQSSADQYSSLSGLELANTKIRRLWMMGGNFDTGNPELNFKTYPNDTAYILSNFAGDIYIQGYEIGINIRAGVHLDQITDTNDLLWKCLYNWNIIEGHGQGGCNAFDPMVLLAAIDNDDYVTCLDYEQGLISFDTQTLRTSFSLDPQGNHYVASTVLTNDEYVNRLNNLLNKYIFPNLSHNKYRLT